MSETLEILITICSFSFLLIVHSLVTQKQLERLENKIDKIGDMISDE